MCVSRCRLRNHRLRALFVLPIVFAVACCAPPHPPPSAPPPPALPLPPPVARADLHAAWAFQETPQACVARAIAPHASLLITVRPSGAIRLSVTLPAEMPAHPTMRFDGPAGSWRVAGTAYHREAVFWLSRTDSSLSRILILLSGGTLRIEPPQPDLPRLSLPPSDVGGQHWFVCARHSVTGT